MKNEKKTTSELAEEIARLRQEIAELEALNAEQKRVNISALERCAFLTTAIESLPHPFYVIDVNNYSIVMANSAAGLGTLSETSTCYALTHGRSEPCLGTEHICPLEEVRQTRKPVTVEHIHFDEDGNPRNVEVRATPILNDEGNLVQMIEFTIDITESKQLEQQLLQSQKMEAVGRLAGGIAHDFNNALTVIMGNTDLILAKLPEGSPYHDRILNIRKAADHSAGLTGQLLAFSRKQIASPRILNVNNVILTLQRMLQRVIGEDVELTTHLGEDVGNIFIDPGQIEQVLMNIVVNAREAMPKGGTIIIETRQIEPDETYVKTHPYVKPGLYACISVSDTGTGMSDEVREQIFEPFFTTKEGGTGLGLSTVYGIVKQNEGYIDVYSEKGTGTTFKIFFPITKECLDESPSEIGRADLVTGSETILVVEDDSAVRDLASEVLTDLGYKVHTFGSAEEALLFARDSDEAINLLLTDVVMPSLNGPELANAILEVDPSIRVLYMSGYTDDSIAIHGILQEGVNLLQKPFNIEEIAKKVREVLDKSET